MIYFRTNRRVFFLWPSAAVGIDLDGRYFFELAWLCCWTRRFFRMNANLDLDDAVAGDPVVMKKLANPITQVVSLKSEVINLKSEVVSLNARLEKAEQDASFKQARIDSLMLEYCPDEMSSEQLEEWGRSQRPISPEEELAIDVAIAKEPK